MSPWKILALAALGLPRAIAHDLDLVGGLPYVLLALVPFAVWLWAGLRAEGRGRLLTPLAIGVAYGVMLAVTHQVLWTEAYDGEPPRLGGELEDAPAGVHEAATRAAAFLSSLAVGAAVGAVLGVIAAAIGSRRGGGRDVPRRTTIWRSDRRRARR